MLSRSKYWKEYNEIVASECQVDESFEVEFEYSDVCTVMSFDDYIDLQKYKYRAEWFQYITEWEECD